MNLHELFTKHSGNISNSQGVMSFEGFQKAVEEMLVEKIDDDGAYTQEQLFKIIAEVCKNLDWAICVPKFDKVSCIVIGEPDELEKSEHEIDVLFETIHLTPKLVHIKPSEDNRPTN